LGGSGKVGLIDAFLAHVGVGSKWLLL
jgi:hypothetical protein